MYDAINVLGLLMFLSGMVCLATLTSWIATENKRYKMCATVTGILLFLLGVAFAFCTIIHNQQIMMGGV